MSGEELYLYTAYGFAAFTVVLSVLMVISRRCNK